MIFKRHSDVLKMASAAKPDDVLNQAIVSYLRGLAGPGPDLVDGEEVYPAVEDLQVTDEAKALKHASISALHVAELAKGCPISLGFKVDCMPANVLDWTSGYNLLEITGAPGIDIRGYDNVEYFTTFTDYQTMCMEIGVHCQTLRSKSWALKNMIRDANTVVELLAVNWES
jgi:hypothetical protein